LVSIRLRGLLESTLLRPIHERDEVYQLVLSFVVVVIGGLSSLRGAFVAAVLVGIPTRWTTWQVPTLDRDLVCFLAAGTGYTWAATTLEWRGGA